MSTLSVRTKFQHPRKTDTYRHLIRAGLLVLCIAGCDSGIQSGNADANSVEQLADSGETPFDGSPSRDAQLDSGDSRDAQLDSGDVRDAQRDSGDIRDAGVLLDANASDATEGTADAGIEAPRDAGLDPLDDPEVAALLAAREADYCVPYAAIRCSAREVCACETEFDVEECRRGYVEECVRVGAIYAEDLLDGVRRLHLASAPACLRAYEEGAAECRVGDIDCRGMFITPVTLGERCLDGSSGGFCADGAGWCDRSRVCVPRPASGGSCDEGGCLAGLTCVEGRCEEVHSEGEACLRDSDCSDSLGCVDRVCRSAGYLGAPCVSDNQCLPWLQCGETNTCVSGGSACDEHDDCAFGGVCEGSNVGLCVTPTTGMRCSSDDNCLEDDYCLWDGVRGQCVERPSIGEPCTDTDLCASDSTCSALGVCVRIPGRGESCREDPYIERTCAAGLYCNGGRCGSLPSVGAACSWRTGCAAGAICVGVGAGVCTSPLPLGAECSTWASACGPGTYCSYPESVCAPLLPEGELCCESDCRSPQQCQPGLGCEQNLFTGEYRCTPWPVRRVGEEGCYSRGCEEGAYCSERIADGMCRAPICDD